MSISWLNVCYTPPWTAHSGLASVAHDLSTEQRTCAIKLKIDWSIRSPIGHRHDDDMHYCIIGRTPFFLVLHQSPIDQLLTWLSFLQFAAQPGGQEEAIIWINPYVSRTTIKQLINGLCTEKCSSTNTLFYYHACRNQIFYASWFFPWHQHQYHTPV